MEAEAKVEDESLVEAIARRVVELLKADDELGPGRYVDAAALAHELSVDRDWIYAHAEELGAIRLGGPHGRLRFDIEVVRERLKPLDPPRRSPQNGARRKRGRPSALPQDERVESATRKGRRASGMTPAPSPGQHQTGGSPG